MSDKFLSMVAVVAIGFFAFGAARWSRSRYKREHAGSTKADYGRFAVIFVSVLAASSITVFIFPQSAFLFLAIAAIVGCLGLVGRSPGVLKDFTYSSIICFLLVGFAGILWNAM